LSLRLLLKGFSGPRAISPELLSAFLGWLGGALTSRLRMPIL
jgi:hypothetical protein